MLRARRLLPAVVASLGLTGNAFAQNMEVTPLTWDFGEVVLGGTAAQVFSIAAIDPYFGSIVNISIVNDDTGAFNTDAPVGDFEIALGTIFDFNVFFAPALEGVFVADLKILSSDLVHPDLFLPLTGRTTGFVDAPGTLALVALGIWGGLPPGDAGTRRTVEAEHPTPGLVSIAG